MSLLCLFSIKGALLYSLSYHNRRDLSMSGYKYMVAFPNVSVVFSSVRVFTNQIFNKKSSPEGEP